MCVVKGSYWSVALACTIVEERSVTMAAQQPIEELFRLRQLLRCTTILLTMKVRCLPVAANVYDVGNNILTRIPI